MAGMDAEIRGLTGLQANVNTANELTVAVTGDSALGGFVTLAGETTAASSPSGRITRTIDVDSDYRIRASIDNAAMQMRFSSVNINRSVVKETSATQTIVQSGGFITLNASSLTTINQGAKIESYQSIPVYGAGATWYEGSFVATQVPQVNQNGFVGAYISASSIAAPTDGYAFVWNPSGEFRCIVYNNGTPAQSVALTAPLANVRYHWLIGASNDKTEFFLAASGAEYSCYAQIWCPAGTASPTSSMSFPIAAQVFTGATAPALAMQLKLGDCWANCNGQNLNQPFVTALARIGSGAGRQPEGVASGITANHANSTAPASAVLSNTAGGYGVTILDGKFQFAAVAGAETDYALFAFLVPAGTAAAAGKSLHIYSATIDLFNMGAASATTPTLLEWCIGYGSTTVSLATAADAAAVKRAAIRAIGTMSVPVGAAIGGNVGQVKLAFQVPLVVDPGQYAHLILKMPVGSATVSQVLRGTYALDAVFV